MVVMPSVASSITYIPNDLMDYILSKIDKVEHISDIYDSCSLDAKFLSMEKNIEKIKFGDNEIVILKGIKFICDMKLHDFKNTNVEQIKNKILKMKEEADSKGKKLFIDTIAFDGFRCEILKVFKKYVKTDSIDHPRLYFTRLDYILDEITIE